MTYDLSVFILTTAFALFLGSAIFHWLTDRWGDDEFEFHDVEQP